VDGASAWDSTPVRYVGLTTRAIAFALDAGIINLVAVIVEVGFALILSLLHLPQDVKTALIAIGGAAYVLWTMAYFVVFWSTTGQTPGDRLMQIRVVAAKGERLKPRRALLRFVGLILAALPLLAGYALILFDSQRRGLQDRIARTVVVEAPQLSLAALRRSQRRAGGSVTPARIARSPHSGDDQDGSLAEAVPQRERLTPDSVGRTGAADHSQQHT
ncbi:MAG: RDD family protein, partial [Candidatus Limnocylindria bacterium]